MLFLASASLLMAEPAALQAQSADSTKQYQMDSVIVSAVRSTGFGFSPFQSKSAIRYHPSLGNDPVRTLAALPASVPASDIKSIPSIAGDDPDRMLILLDDMPVTLPIRLLGAFSVFNPLVTQSIDVTSAGFSAAHGNAFPAGIHVRTDRDIDAPTLRGIFDITSSNIAVGLPLSEDGSQSAIAAFRVSHMDAIAPLLPASARQQLESFTPHLQDFYFHIDTRPMTATTLKAQTLVTREHGSLTSFERSFDYSWNKFFVGLHSCTIIGSTNIKVSGSWSRDALDIESAIPVEGAGTVNFSTSGVFDVARGMASAEFPCVFNTFLTAGADIAVFQSDLSFATSTEWLNRTSPLLQSFANSAIYLEHTIPDLFSAIRITTGVRTTHFGLAGRVGVEPRLEIAADLSVSTRITVLYGRYLTEASDVQMLQGFLSLLATPNQPPRMLVTSQHPPGFPEESRALGISVAHGTEISNGVLAQIAVDGYWKDEHNLLQSVRYPAVFTLLDSTSLQPSQRFSGKKYGAGVRMGTSITPLHLTVGASCYWQKSTITDRLTNRAFPNGNDIPLSLKIAANYDSKPLRIDMTFQHYAGAPTTDRYFLRGTDLFGNHFYFPIDRELNSGRLPAYNRLDVGVSYGLTWDGWQIEPYVQVLNLMNSRNVSHYSYDFSPSQPDNVESIPQYNSMPLLPIAGVRVEKSW